MVGDYVSTSLSGITAFPAIAVARAAIGGVFDEANNPTLTKSAPTKDAEALHLKAHGPLRRVSDTSLARIVLLCQARTGKVGSPRPMRPHRSSAWWTAVRLGQVEDGLGLTVGELVGERRTLLDCPLDPALVGDRDWKCPLAANAILPQEHLACEGWQPTPWRVHIDNVERVRELAADIP
jgi:hypothetical protein